MNPLDENCREFRVDGVGKVIGVKLGITPVAGSEYEVYSVRLDDEYEAQGQTIARCFVYDENRMITGLPVRLAWPGAGPTFSASGLPGNPNNVHMIVNKYWPPDSGPLAVYVGREHNKPMSDIVYGLGLPMGRHVRYTVNFRKRGAVPIDPIDPGSAELQRQINALVQEVGALQVDVARLRTTLRTWTGEL